MPEPVIQSQESVQPEHPLSFQTPINKPTGPVHINQPIGPRIKHGPTPFFHDLILRPPPNPTDVTDLKDTRKDLVDLVMDRNIDFEENSPYQEGIISETYERQDKSYFKDPSELKDLIDTTKLVQKFLPKQTDIDKILDIIKRKVLKGTHLPITIKKIQAGYLTSPYFKVIYLYLAQNKLPSKRSVIHKVETLAERFILLDSLLFKFVTTPERNNTINSTRGMCRQYYNIVSHQSLCRKYRCYKNIPHYQ